MLLSGLTPVEVPAATPWTEPAPLPAWSELRLSGRKLGQTARISMRASLVTAAAAASSWLSTDAPSPRTTERPEVLLLESLTTVVGRVFDEKAWLDAGTRAALQITDIETGAKLHRRTYRMLEGGFVFEERLPAGAAQEALPPEQWQKVTRTTGVFPDGLPDDMVVTGVLALLCGDLTGRLQAVGDSVRHVVFVQKQLEEVTLTVESLAPVPASFSEDRGQRSAAVAGERPALAIRIVSRPLDPRSSGAFRLFGMSDSVLVLWDQRLGVPLSVSGHISVIGDFTVSLDSVSLR